MMVLCYILLGLFLLISVILFSKIVFTVKYDGNFNFIISFYFIKLKFNIPILYKQKKDEEDDVKYVTVKEEKESAKQKKSKKKQEEKKPFPGIKNVVCFFKDAAIDILGAVVHSFHLEKLYFMGVAASNDAAKTAELYGVMCTASSALHQFATNARGIKKDAVYIEVRPDFLAETADFYADLRFSIRVWRLLLIAKKALSIWQGYKKLSRDVQAQKLLEESSDKDNKKSQK